MKTKTQPSTLATCDVCAYNGPWLSFVCNGKLEFLALLAKTLQNDHILAILPNVLPVFFAQKVWAMAHAKECMEKQSVLYYKYCLVNARKHTSYCPLYPVMGSEQGGYWQKKKSGNIVWKCESL